MTAWVQPAWAVFSRRSAKKAAFAVFHQDDVIAVLVGIDHQPAQLFPATGVGEVFRQLSGLLVQSDGQGVWWGDSMVFPRPLAVLRASPDAAWGLCVKRAVFTRSDPRE